MRPRPPNAQRSLLHNSPSPPLHLPLLLVAARVEVLFLSSPAPPLRQAMRREHGALLTGLEHVDVQVEAVGAEEGQGVELGGGVGGGGVAEAFVVEAGEDGLGGAVLLLVGRRWWSGGGGGRRGVEG